MQLLFEFILSVYFEWQNEILKGQAILFSVKYLFFLSSLKFLYRHQLLKFHLEREEFKLLFRDLKESPLLITFFPDVEKFLGQK